MAENTIGTVLKCGTAEASLTKMCPIKDFPDLGGPPEMIDTTTLDDPMETNIPGVQSAGAMEFTANYTDTDYDAVAATAGKEQFYALEFASGTKFAWKGQHTVYATGAGVNGVKEMKIVIARSTAITRTKKTGA
ncbi:phage tail tube protein [Clostridium sp. Marseille-P299]|uniref:phage tail tube protein n=1 Tax=Clostridium sp. Marseille-P299 TaxID=1805477 RepID=UPI00082CDA77|nr:phage tail tube protein [Clostridium sp. Marseille-P299]